MTSPATWLRRLTATTTAGGLLLLGAPVVLGHTDAVDYSPSRSGQAAPVTSADLVLVSGHRHRARKIVHYRVRRGDTATGLAVRFHAWTDELLKLNHLRPGSTLYVGERLRIPVVRAAARRAHHHKTRHKAHRAAHHKAQHKTHRTHHKAHRTHPKPRAHSQPRRHPAPSRARVRSIIIRAANLHDVNPHLALAVGWQESGWQMRLTSSANAIGVMQVLPSTGRWMSQVVGRRLHLYRVHDNVTAGVVLLKLLRQQARLRPAVAGYYQGLAGVRAFGMYDSTKAYVANVLALKKRLAHGWNPS